MLKTSTCGPHCYTSKHGDKETWRKIVGAWTEPPVDMMIYDIFINCNWVVRSYFTVAFGFLMRVNMPTDQRFGLRISNNNNASNNRMDCSVACI